MPVAADRTRAVDVLGPVVDEQELPGRDAELGDDVLVDVGVRLHQPELGITPDELLFVDNKSQNVEGARAVGGDGHVFTDAAGLEAWLRGLQA